MTIPGQNAMVVILSDLHKLVHDLLGNRQPTTVSGQDTRLPDLPEDCQLLLAGGRSLQNSLGECQACVTYCAFRSILRKEEIRIPLLNVLAKNRQGAAPHPGRRLGPTAIATN